MRKLIKLCLVDKKSTSGIWVMVIQAARKATSSTKCGVETGASTARSSEMAKMKYAVGSIMWPKDKAIPLQCSTCGKGSKATALMNAALCFSGKDLLGSRDLK